MNPSAIKTGSRRRRGKELLRRFVDALEQQGSKEQMSVRPWLGGHRRSQNLVEFLGPPGQTILYIKTRSDSGGFWGVNTNQIESLSSSGKPWCVVFLIGPRDKGYLMGASEVSEAIAKRRWSYGTAGDYKVHEGHELAGVRHFNSYVDLVREILDAEVKKAANIYKASEVKRP